MGSTRFLLFAGVVVVILWWTIPWLKVGWAHIKAKRAENFDEAEESISDLHKDDE